MAGYSTRRCPLCGEVKKFRTDYPSCGCRKREEAAEKIKEKNEIIGDRWNISLPKTHIHTLEDLIAYCKVDLSVWKVERFVCNKWEVGMRPAIDGGSPITLPLFQIKAFLSRKLDIVNAKAEIEALKKEARSLRAAPKHTTPPAPSGNMLELCLPDHHFGELAWGEETGHGNYDTKIARETFNRAVNSLLSRVTAYKFESVLFIVGNDLLNTDSLENMTTRGTVKATDGRFQKTFSLVRSLMIESIERLRLLAPVHVLMVPGNHDRLSVWHLGDSLECWFHNYKDVHIDNRPLYRKYHHFGKVLLMFTHGDQIKRENLPLIMATEQPEVFGKTIYREVHTGHLHQVRLNEDKGIRVRILPSLCQPDDWHSDHGFIGNIRSSEAYIWNKEDGLIGIAIFNDNKEKA